MSVNEGVSGEGKAGEGGEGWDTFCLHPQPPVFLRLTSLGEGVKAKYAYYCRECARGDSGKEKEKKNI